jgi:hypothetical protein
VLAVQLRGECPASERAVELLLGQPDGELPVPIEAQPQPGVAQDVVDRTEPARYELGSSTEATRAVGRDDDVVAEEEP